MEICSDLESSANIVVEGKLPETFNKENIVFNAAEHSYKLFLPTGECLIARFSVTEFINIFFPSAHPNFGSICKQMVARRSYVRNPKYEFVPADAPAELAEALILKSWNTKKLLACEYGTEMHFMFETFYQTGVLLNNPLLHRERAQFKRFLRNQGRYLQIFGTEMRLFDRGLGLAGSTDAIFKDVRTGDYVLLDWKRCGITTFAEAAYADHLGITFKDPKLKKYSLQLNVYANILEVVYNLRVSTLVLWIVDPTQPLMDYVYLEVPRLPIVHSQMAQLRSGERDIQTPPTRSEYFTIN